MSQPAQCIRFKTVLKWVGADRNEGEKATKIGKGGICYLFIESKSCKRP